ncbi:MAG: hypothetical protein M3R02_09625 [Chloroflexota bacterium]|nr:hypothetical protein [Chloroflexota bacterium]
MSRIRRFRGALSYNPMSLDPERTPMVYPVLPGWRSRAGWPIWETALSVRARVLELIVE